MANSIGDVFGCDSCGAEVTVTKDCSCKECSITCCGKPMKPKDAPANKAGGCCSCS
jgi:hypothetical protein